MTAPYDIHPGKTYRRTDIKNAVTRVDGIRNGLVIGHTFGRMLSSACAHDLSEFAGKIENIEIPDAAVLDGLWKEACVEQLGANCDVPQDVMRRFVELVYPYVIAEYPISLLGIGSLWKTACGDPVSAFNEIPEEVLRTFFKSLAQTLDVATTCSPR